MSAMPQHHASHHRVARHVAVWSSAYLRGGIYAMIAGLSDFLSRTESDAQKMAEMTWFGWLRVALFAVLAGVLWGVLDEIHQAFVPGRSADLLDLVADSVGIVIGTGARTLLHHFARRAR